LLLTYPFGVIASRAADRRSGVRSRDSGAGGRDARAAWAGTGPAPPNPTNMDARQRRRLLRQCARATHRATRALGAAGQRLAERLAYRPREVVVVALLGAGLFGGLAVERWRARYPESARRLEAEPARSTSQPAVSPGPRIRSRNIAAD